MPLNLDSCITSIFIPGNIGASSGQTPIVRVMPPRVSATLTVQIREVATATAVVTVVGDIGAVVMETAAAVDAVYFAQVFDVVVGEVAPATDTTSVHVPGVVAAAVTETATAVSAQDATLGATGFAGSAMLGGEMFSVVVTGDGVVRQANLGGVMLDTGEG